MLLIAKKMVKAIFVTFILSSILLIAGVILFVTVIEPRSFSIEDIAVEAFVRPDGRMYVVERVTYEFSGADSQPFTVGTRNFEPGPTPWRITMIRAYDSDGNQRTTLLESPYLFEWDISPAYSGTYTYELRYVVEGAVQVYSDVGELYWNWIGFTSPAVGSWSANVHMPEGEGDVRAWAHGPLEGVVRIEGDLVTSAVDDVAAGQYVDNRVVVPATRFSEAQYRRDEERLPTILAEEAAWADAANRAREEWERSEERRRRAADLLNAAALPLIALGALAFWLIWRRWGDDPPKPADIGDYFRDVPDDAPAVAAALLRFGVVDSDSFAATVMDLARRGHMRIEAYEAKGFLGRNKKEHRFIKTTPTPPDSLRGWEREVLDWFFSDVDQITQEGLIAKSRSKQSQAASFWSEFQSDVKKDLYACDYIVRGKGPVFIMHGLIVLALAGVGVLALVVKAWLAGGLLIAASVVLLPLGALHRSRTPEGTRRFHEWTALRRFLKDFSRLDEAPAGHLELWDQYLVAAVALGVSAELLEALETKFPQLAESSSGLATWYAGRGATRDLGGIGSFSSSFAGPTVSSFSPPSSSSGGGGGFSSGGGGGGGGGGFGAR